MFIVMNMTSWPVNKVWTFWNIFGSSLASYWEIFTFPSVSVWDKTTNRFCIVQYISLMTIVLFMHIIAGNNVNISNM